MKLKTLVVVVVVLAALCAAAYWGNRPPSEAPADPRVGQTVFDAATVGAAAGVRITDQGKTVSLTRGPNGVWRDDSYFGLPADFSKLSGLTSDFTTVKIDRLVTVNPGRISRLGFGGTRVELLDGTGRVLTAVDLGKNADQGGRFLRYGPEAKAYLANLSTWIDSDPKNWADATLVNVKPEDVARIEFPFDGDQPITATRATKDAAWKADGLPAGQELNADKVTSALTTLATLRFSDTTDPKDPLAVAAAGHARVYRLTTFDGRTLDIALGRTPETKRLKTPAAATAPDAKAPAKPAAPEYETVPAGPVFAFITSTIPRSPIPAMMRARAFEVDDYNYTSLPQKPADILETATPPPPAAK